MKNSSEITNYMLGMMHPFILVFGLYIIMNGHHSPGGGFQGGAVLTAVFLTKYLADPIVSFSLKPFQLIEKIFFIGIVLFAVFYLLMEIGPKTPFFQNIYLLTMNFLIGIKVWCGLSVIFFRFVFYEGR